MRLHFWILVFDYLVNAIVEHVLRVGALELENKIVQKLFHLLVQFVCGIKVRLVLVIKTRFNVSHIQRLIEERRQVHHNQAQIVWKQTFKLRIFLLEIFKV